MKLNADIGQFGESLEEAMSRDSDPNDRDAPIRYEVVGPRINHAEMAVGRQQDIFYKQYPDSPRHGHKWGVRTVRLGDN